MVLVLSTSPFLVEKYRFSPEKKGFIFQRPSKTASSCSVFARAGGDGGDDPEEFQLDRKRRLQQIGGARVTKVSYFTTLC